MRAVSGWKREMCTFPCWLSKTNQTKLLPQQRGDQTPELSWRSGVSELSRNSPKQLLLVEGEAALSSELTAWQGHPGCTKADPPKQPALIYSWSTTSVKKSPLYSHFPPICLVLAHSGMLLVKHKVDFIQFTTEHSFWNKQNPNRSGDIPTLFPWTHSGDIPLLTSPCLQWVTPECSQSCRGSCPALPTHLTPSPSPASQTHPNPSISYKRRWATQLFARFYVWPQLAGAGDSVGAWRTVGITRICIWI